MTFRSVLHCAATVVGLTLASCTDDYYLEPGRIYLCTSDYPVMGAVGYLVADTAADASSQVSTGRLYSDLDELMSTPQRVSCHARRHEVFLRGDAIGQHSCSLSPYLPPAYRPLPEGVDYVTERYDWTVQTDVKYGEAEGYWTSYPDTAGSTYLDIVRRKIPEMFEGLKPCVLTMDIYSPTGGVERPRPLVVMIHGGGFFNGDKADIEYQRWCQRFASCGYVAASVNYRLGYSLAVRSDQLWGFSVNRPADELARAQRHAADDADSAIRYLISHKASELAIDTTRIYVAGCSAGAIIALRLAFCRPQPEEAAEPSRPYSISAVCNMWGAVADLACLGSNPSLPILSIHGEQDPIVDYRAGIPFLRYIESVTDVNLYLDFLGRSHYLSAGFNALKNALLHSSLDAFFDPMYGSYSIDSLAHQLDMRSTLIPSPMPHKHTLVKDSIGQLNHNHVAYYDSMAHFFHREMIGHPVGLTADAMRPQRIRLTDPTDVEACSWSVEGGIIKPSFLFEATLIPRSADVLMFADAPVHSVTVSGIYRSGIPFRIVKQLE